MNYMITGGSGFIGSNFLNNFVWKHPEINFINVDALTYAGNNENVQVEGYKNYSFIEADISDKEEIFNIFKEINPDKVIHFAAESHVDQSILSPEKFIFSNIVGTFNLLEAALKTWNGNYQNKRFHHISTDEVYGSLGKEGAFTESTAYSPNSPYSASKASSDHLVRAYNHTFNLPTSISNCSNNYGLYQHDEKLIPTVIRHAIKMQPIPIYGDGGNYRDWLYVIDHCEAIWKIIHSEEAIGQTYNIGGSNDITNLELVDHILKQLSKKTNIAISNYESLISFIEDRKGHDFRYAIDSSKIESELNWKAETNIREGLEKTVAYYLSKYSE